MKNVLNVIIVIIILLGCQKEQFNDKDYFSISPVENSSDKRIILYDDFTDSNTMNKNWQTYEGPTFDNLYKIKSNSSQISVETGCVTLSSPRTVVIGTKYDLPADNIKIIITLNSSIIDRSWFISLSDIKMDMKYTINFDRTESFFYKKADIQQYLYPDTMALMKKTVVMLTKTKNQLRTYINGIKIFDFIDLLPVLTPKLSKLFIGSVESKINIDSVKIVEQKEQYTNHLDECFYQQHPLVYVDNYHRYKNIDKNNVHYLQALAALKKYKSLHKTLNMSTGIPAEIKKFFRVFLLLHNRDYKKIKNLEPIAPDASEYLITNYKEIFNDRMTDLTKIDRSATQYVLFFKAIKSFFRNHYDIMFQSLMGFSETLFHHHNELSIEILSDLEYKFADDAEKQMQLLNLRCIYATSTNDTISLTKYYNIAINKYPNISSNWISWIQLDKAENFMNSGIDSQALQLLNSIIDRYSKNKLQWLWAWCDKYKIMKDSTMKDTDIKKLKELISDYDMYQRQISFLKSIMYNLHDAQQKEVFIKNLFQKKDISSVKVSSVESGLYDGFAVIDEDLSTRWGSKHGQDTSWLMIEFNSMTEINGITIYWEYASAKKYEILSSENGVIWQTIKRVTDGARSEIKMIPIDNIKMKYLKILMQERTTQWGYSIWEINWF